jgi:hypothetical protein
MADLSPEAQTGTDLVEAGTADVSVSAVPEVGIPDALVSESLAANYDSTTTDSSVDAQQFQCVCGANQECSPWSGNQCVCKPGFWMCGEQCFDTINDSAHCGSCAPCPSGYICSRALCVIAGM